MNRKQKHRQRRILAFLGAGILTVALVDLFLPCHAPETLSSSIRQRNQYAEEQKQQLDGQQMRRTALKLQGTPYHTVLACLIYNEAQYLLEWISWHRLLGIDHFYLYNHRSTDSSRTLLTPLINAGLITYITIPETNTRGEPASFSDASIFFRDDFPLRIRAAKWVAHWDVDEFLYLGPFTNVSHFLERKVFKDAGGVKLSRRSASTSGQSVRIAQGDLAVMTYTDIENEATAKKRDPGKMIVRAEKSETGVILGHKLSRSSGPLVNIAGAHGKKLRSGEWMGLDVESVAEAPFLIHHITRSYEECKEKDAWTADRQGTWRHKMPVSVCDQRNASSTHYRSEDYMKQPNVVCRGLQSKRKELCEEMRRLHPSRCDEVSCCEG